LIFLRRAASQIVENILARKWTASVVLEAYIARAAQAQEAMNCLTEGTYRLCFDYLNSVIMLGSCLAHATNSVL
jgi:hypothetical protein